MKLLSVSNVGLREQKQFYGLLILDVIFIMKISASVEIDQLR